MPRCNPRHSDGMVSCSCKSSRSDGEGSIPADVIYSSGTSSHLLPAVFSYLITVSSFVLGCEKDQTGLYLRGETTGLIRSLFYSTDFALKHDVIADHLRHWPNGFARELVFKMMLVDGLWHWNAVFWWVTVSSLVRQHLFSTERKRKVVRQDETAGKSRCTSPAPRN